MNEIPKGFEPIPITSTFAELVGPFYHKKFADGFIVGVRVTEKHSNARGNIHGGLISTLADFALGYNVPFFADTPLPIVTVNLSTDFIGSAKLDDWLEVKVDVHKVGKVLAFANAYIYVNERLIARSTGVFNIG